MAVISKFLFERTFDEQAASGEGDRNVRRHTPAELAAARAEGVEEGRTRGRTDALASIEAQTLAILERAAHELGAIRAAQAEAAQSMMKAGLELASAIACKAMPAFAERDGLGEIEALLRDCLGQLVDEPRVVIRVNDAMLDPLERRSEALAHATGFEGKLVLLADATLGPSDCRIEWADGGVVRNQSKLMAELDQALNRAFGAAGATTLSPSSQR